VSQQKRKRIEEVFGWLKTIGLMRQTRFRGRRRVGWMFVFSLAVYNLVRIRTWRSVRRDAPPLLSGLRPQGGRSQRTRFASPGRCP